MASLEENPKAIDTTLNGHKGTAKVSLRGGGNPEKRKILDAFFLKEIRSWTEGRALKRFHQVQFKLVIFVEEDMGVVCGLVLQSINWCHHCTRIFEYCKRSEEAINAFWLCGNQQ